MSSSTKWIIPISTDPNITTMNRKIVMDLTNVNDLTTYVAKNPLSSLIYGDYTKWCSSLIAYPFGLNSGATEENFTVFSDTSTGVKCYGLLEDKYTQGFYLGQYFYPKPSNYLGYSPFTKVQIWLPYYNFIELKVEDIADKYIQFRLFVDFNTGRAMYIVGVNDNSVECSNPPFLYTSSSDYVDDSETVVLSKSYFIIGQEIPLGSTGMTDLIRNMSLVAVRGATSLISSGITQLSGYHKATTTSKEVETTQFKNFNTNRLNIGNRTTTEKTSVHDYSNSQKAHRIGTCFDTFNQALANMQLSPQLSTSNNVNLEQVMSQSVMIITRTVLPTLDISSTEYKHIYGKPLGQIKQLSEVSGYTEITNILLEGEGFSAATSEELDILNHMLDGGIILPSGTTVEIKKQLDKLKGNSYKVLSEKTFNMADICVNCIKYLKELYKDNPLFTEMEAEIDEYVTFTMFFTIASQYIFPTNDETITKGSVIKGSIGNYAVYNFLGYGANISQSSSEIGVFCNDANKLNLDTFAGLFSLSITSSTGIATVTDLYSDIDNIVLKFNNDDDINIYIYDETNSVFSLLKYIENINTTDEAEFKESLAFSTLDYCQYHIFTTIFTKI